MVSSYLKPKSSQVVSVEIPKSALTVVEAEPTTVSQQTSEAVLGIAKRAYLASLGDYRDAGGEVGHLGKLRIVDRAAYVRWLLSRSAPVKANDEEPISGVDAVLAEVGCVRVAR